ncbi:MAG: Ty1/Copia family ribonuclease HI, partial [Gaiellaceae bacterium]
VYIDDIIIIAKDPMIYIKQLQFEYYLKGVGLPSYYLGGDVEMKNGKMIWSAKTYIKNICERIEKMFEIKLRSQGSPMIQSYHPELDISDLLQGDMITKYQMLIGAANWIVILGRFDILYTVSTMARYSTMPRNGHLDALLRLFGYLKAYMKAKIIVDTSMPNVDGELTHHNWQEIYPYAHEELPPDMPIPKGKEVLMTTYVDADHAHDVVTRRSVTGLLMFLNNTPIKWYSKRQNTVETSTYGSELVAARIASEMIIEVRYKLRMLGVPIHGPAQLYGDNQSVITNTTIPSSNLKKKHNAISYHRV